jgi:protein-S-isoprenylcysteine O-methyltransferase Ste14
MWLGMALLTMNFWFITTFVFLYWVYYERIMFAEEQFLRSKFGKVYTDWAERTPAFIPGFKNWKRNTLPFNWKKVLAREKTGLVLVFMAFFLFNVLSDSIRNQGFIIERDGWLIAFAASLIYYFVVKVLRKRSSILREKV